MDRNPLRPIEKLIRLRRAILICSGLHILEEALRLADALCEDRL